MQLILASSSKYRKALLSRLHVPFQAASPDIDETPLAGEKPADLVKRLALQKARKVAEHYPDALIIGSDQSAVLNQQILGKPHCKANAVKQLRQASGKALQLITGLCLLNTKTGAYQLDIVAFTVFMKKLSDETIKRYIEIDKPLDCAGSFKWEQLGIALFRKMEGNDVTALQGLPLIRLIEMLETEGMTIL